MSLLDRVRMKQDEQVKRLTVGPVPCHPGMLAIMGKQYFSTRDPFFVDVMVALQGFLQASVGTTHSQVVMEHGSGSSGLCAIGNHLLKPGDSVVCLNTGKFGERWVKIAKKRQCDVYEIVVDWEKVVDWEAVGAVLKARHPFAFLMQHSETSTGAVHSLAQAHQMISKYSPGTLLVVDAISSWGSLPIDMDANQIDAVVGCSQKGFMLPTGLHLMSFSDRALQVIEKNDVDGFITDFSHAPLYDIRDQLKGKPRFSMDSNALMALVFLKEEIIDPIGGWPAWFESVRQRAKRIHQAIRDVGLSELSESAGDVVMAIPFDDSYDVKEVRKQLVELGFEVNKSQDEAKFKGIRIGNMGYITDDDIAALSQALRVVF